MTYAITELTNGQYQARIIRDGNYFGAEYTANSIEDILSWIEVMLKGL